ncbi:hypothetical protein FNV43_RR15447 [Rhamnella rubrinervis]|uniref:DUF1985 domain-containing protein n=1 Tax=Rhamnella rubrinervis TaxID=2594499 RepID=A0A8K0E6J8_9ROSA|nr:hypothetical protein FNV43_RR15447 [Rhamnella rubrinervis]
MVKDVFTNTIKYMEDDDMVKFYLCECGLIKKESHSQIDNDHLSIIDDLEYFNYYLWGEMSWAATISSLHKALEKPNRPGTIVLEGLNVDDGLEHDDGDDIEPPKKRAHMNDNQN